MLGGAPLEAAVQELQGVLVKCDGATGDRSQELARARVEAA